MKIYAHSTIFGVKESGIQIVSDFMIPFVLLYNDLKKEIRLNKLSFCVHSQEGEIIQKEIDSSALASRFRSAIEE